MLRRQPRQRGRGSRLRGRRGLPLILVDANLLLYASVRELPEHAAARGWLDERLSGSARVGLPWSSLLTFVRLVTQRRLFERPAPVAEAWAQAERWLDAEPAWVPVPTARHRAVLGQLMSSVARPDLVPDAHLAALAVEHGLELYSTDSDFARFPGLRWENPLA